MPLSSPYRQKIAEITEKGLKGKALSNAIAKAMDSDISLELATEKEKPKTEKGEYGK